MNNNTNPVSSPPTPLWHTLPAEQVLSELDTAPGGLNDQEAARRLEIHGPTGPNRAGGAVPAPISQHPDLRPAGRGGRHRSRPPSGTGRWYGSYSSFTTF
jgi:hypothetical protein